MKRILANGALVAGSLLIVLVGAEFLLRLRYVEPLRKPDPQILAIQPYLELDDHIGFKWRANISADENIVFEVKDAEFEPLSTDNEGFINHPSAIASRRNGDDINVAGIGDSFMEHGSHEFYSFFQEHGLNFYGFAIHFQSPPQYTSILEKYVLPLEPDWVVYGLFENDFQEARDFENWRDSGLNWFEFHSGTWCGTSLDASRLGRLRARYLRGYSGVSRVLKSRVRGDRMSVSGPSSEDIERVVVSIRRGVEAARNGGTRFLLMLIPSRATITSGESHESSAYDTVLDKLNDLQVHTLDLRPLFQQDENPLSLFYKVDGHWNRRGIEKAARAILEFIRSHDKSP